MTHRFENELSEPIATLARSVDEAPAEAVETAQQRLMARIPVAPRAVRTPPRWLAVTASVVLVIVAVVFVPMLTGTGDAFAAVQERFRHFNTLAMTVVQRVGGQTVQTSRTVVDARGVLRTDVGEQLSIIVDRPRGRVLTLLHGSRQAMLAPIPARGTASNDSLQWLDELRNFKGQATPLPTSRVIQGQLARGWALTIHGVKMEIWADRDDLPLTMRLTSGAGMEIDYRFEFDRPLTPGHLSSDLPVGYQWVNSDSE